MSKQFYFKLFSFAKVQYSSIWHIDKIPSCTAAPSQSGPGNNTNERVLCIPHRSSITGISPSYCLVTYPRHSLEESYTSAKMWSLYSIVPCDWAKYVLRSSLQVFNSRLSFSKPVMKKQRKSYILLFYINKRWRFLSAYYFKRDYKRPYEIHDFIFCQNPVMSK